MIVNGLSGLGTFFSLLDTQLDTAPNAALQPRRTAQR
jgi:hypothetical protein